jgi:hypothetical protein
MTKEKLVDIFRNKCLSGFAKKPSNQFAENSEDRICISTIIGDVTVVNYSTTVHFIIWNEPITPFETNTVSFELRKQEFIDLKNIYFDNLKKESSIDTTEVLFRNFIRINHLTKKWEEYLIQNAGNLK